MLVKGHSGTQRAIFNPNVRRLLQRKCFGSVIRTRTHARGQRISKASSNLCFQIILSRKNFVFARGFSAGKVQFRD